MRQAVSEVVATDWRGRFEKGFAGCGKLVHITNVLGSRVFDVYAFIPCLPELIPVAGRTSGWGRSQAWAVGGGRLPRRRRINPSSLASTEESIGPGSAL